MVKKKKDKKTLPKKQQDVEYFSLNNTTEYIKIYGLQRSGTNYISHLLNENFQNVKALVNVGGWKHGMYAAPWILGKEVHVMGVVKNPYAWLVSMYNYWGPNRKLNIGPDLRGVTFDHFVRNKVFFEKQKDIPYLMRSENPVQQWNNMNFHWLSIRMNAKKLCVITYETALNDIEAALKGIEENFGLKRKGEIINSDNTFTPSGENLKPSGDKFDKKDYYLQGGFLSHYTPELLEFVNEELDLDLMVHFNYNLLKPDILEKGSE